MNNNTKKTLLIYTRLFIIGCIFFSPMQTKAQTKARQSLIPSIAAPSVLLNNQPPVAQWIWDGSVENSRNYYLLLRKTINLQDIPNKAEAFVSAFAFADLYINGKLVDRCPMNCDPEFQVYEKVDLSGYFKKGANTISALAYNFGEGMHHRIKARGGFFLQAKLTVGENKVIQVNSDNSWFVKKADAWDNQTELRSKDAHLIGFIEKYDARKMPADWKENTFDQRQWQTAKTLGVPPVAPWNKIVKVERPPLFRENIYPVRHWFAGDKIVYDFGKEITGNPVIELFARYAGAGFEMGTAERLLPDSTILYKDRVNYTDYYTAAKGLQTWSPITWRGFRYLCVSASDSIIFKSISAINRHYNYNYEGSFECSDPLLNEIYQTGIATLLLCAQDTYMDTPWREQTHYVAGDTRFLQKYAYYPFGLSSEFLMRYNIFSGAWSQRWSAEGAIRSRYPTGYLLEEGTSVYLVDYELEYVIMLGEYYRYFGKPEPLQQVYPNLKKLMGYFEKFKGKEHGLLTKIPGWIVLDHPDTYPMDLKDEITAMNCLYYEALKQAAFIAKTINHDDAQAGKWNEQAGELKLNIRKWLWSPEKQLFLDSYGSTQCSQQTQVYAMLYGLAEPDELPAMQEAVANMNRSSEQSFSYYLLHAMFDAKPQWSLDFIRKNWGDQMKSPLFNGAWHENWDIASITSDLMTTSHAWCSGPTALLPQKVLGVEPISNGWQHFAVQPNPCDLKWAKGIVPTPFGSIYVNWENKAEELFKLYVLVPTGTTAKISVPGSDPDKIKINNLAWNKISAVKWLGNKNGRLEFQVTAGEYTFEKLNK